MTAMKTYSVQIMDYIKNALMNGTLKPGDKVNEVHLAAALSVSRAPVREALQILAKDGLIVSIPQRGKFITALTPKEIQDHYFIGGVLEGAAVASCLAEYTKEEFLLLEGILLKMQSIVAKYADARGTPAYAEGMAKLDISFHETLLARCTNKLLIEHTCNACQRITLFLLFRYWPHAFTGKEVEERHRRILNAVITRSPTKVERTIREHYRELGDRMSSFGITEKPLLWKKYISKASR